MKKTKNYTGLFLIFFIVALFAMNTWKANGKENRQFSLDAPKIPFMRVSNKNTELTDLRGYRSKEAKSYAKNTVIPLGQSKKIFVSFGPNIGQIESLSYEILKKEDEKSVADGVTEQFTYKDGYANATVTVDDELRENTEYIICFTLSLPRWQKVYYYASIEYGMQFHLTENMACIRAFHDEIFTKSKEITEDAQSMRDTTDNDFAKTTMKSSQEAISFGENEPKMESEISYCLKEVRENALKTELTYIMSIQRENRSKQYYKVQEIYEVSYDKKKTQLLDYTRKVESFFNPEFVYPSKQEILVGITKEDAPQYLESDSSKKICFVQAGQLWLYDYRRNTMTQVFAFGGDNFDIRSNFDQNNIRLLHMDDEGNTDFLVYGYMSRGEHEGENGISLYHYDAADCLVEEKIFISSNYKYSLLNAGVQEMAYFDGENYLYLFLSGNLYRIHVQDSNVEKMQGNIGKKNIAVSKSNKMVAVQPEDAKKNKKIILWNLQEGKNQEIVCEDSERIKIIGFVLEDFVYGIADEKNLLKKGSIFPMGELKIVNENGEEIRNYQKENRYLLKAKISGNVIAVTLGKKKENKYQKIPMQEYIRYQKSDADEITFVRHYDVVQWSQLYMKFPNYVYVQNGAKVRKPGILR